LTISSKQIKPHTTRAGYNMEVADLSYFCFSFLSETYGFSVTIYPTTLHGLGFRGVSVEHSGFEV
jgi:hypothetical protein